MQQSWVFGVVLTTAIVGAGVVFGSHNPDASTVTLTVGLAIFSISLPLWWSLISDLLTVRLEALKVAGDQKDLLMEVIQQGLRQLWALFYAQLVGIICTVALMLAKDPTYARTLVSVWAMLTLVSVAGLMLLPTLRDRIQRWKEAIAKFERDKKAADDLIDRLTKAAGEADEKPSPFKPYPEYKTKAD